MVIINYTCTKALQYRSSFQSSTLIGRAVTRSQTSLGVRARFRDLSRSDFQSSNLIHSKYIVPSPKP